MSIQPHPVGLVTVCLIPCPSLPLLLYFLYVRSEGSGETVHMHGSPEPSLLADGISTNVLCAGPYFVGTVKPVLSGHPEKRQKSVRSSKRF